MMTLQRLCWTLAMVLMAGGVAATPALAQEQQVPLDPDSTVYTIDADLRQELGLFPEVQGFQQAQLFQVESQTYELVIQYEQQGQVLRERRTLTAADVEQLRQRVAQQLQSTGTRVGIEQPGRAEVLTWTTILGLAEGGLIVGAIGPDDGSFAAGFPLLTGALGFFVPLFATQDRPVTEASGTLTGYGGLQGYGHIAQIVGLMGGDDVDDQAVAGLAAVGGAAGATAGYVLGAKQGWSPGMAEMIAYNGTYGNFVGLGAGAMLAGDDNDRLAAGTSLLGAWAGMYAGHRLGRSGAYTRGDARIYALSGLLGARLAGSLIIVSEIEETRVNAGLLTGMGLAGLGVGTALVKDRDFSTYESNIITLGDLAGSLLGAGLGTVVDGSGDTITVMQALGSVLGFGLTYGIFSGDAGRRASAATSGIDLDLQITPSLGATSLSGARQAGSQAPWMPTVTLRGTF